MANIANESILAVRAVHPYRGDLHFEAAKQDRRLYYRLMVNDRSGGSLTDEKHALDTIVYWRQRGWVKEAA